MSDAFDSFDTIDADLEALMRTTCDGSASPADYAALEKRLLADRAARAYYLRLLQTDAALQWEHAPKQKSTSSRTPKPDDEAPFRGRVVGISDGPKTPTLSAAGVPMYRKGYEPQPFKLRPHHYALIAATLLAACGLAAYLLTTSVDPEPSPPEPSSPPPVATLIQNTGNLRTPHGYPAEGDDYGRGEYTLATGTAEFMLTNSVNVKLRGNTRMIMRNDMNVALTRGSAEFVVPNDAKGFTVHLPDKSKVVDLGTAFKVELDDDGKTELHVTKGIVTWTVADSDAQPVFVHAGQTARLVDGRPVAAFDKTIEIVNHSFEVDGPSVESPLNAWTCSAPKGYGTQSIGSASRPADGKLVAWLNHQGTERTLYQETDATIIAGTTYTLTVNVDQYGAFQGSTGLIRLYGSESGFEFPLAELPVAPASGEALLDQSIRFTATDEQAGQKLGIALVVTGGVQLRWDNVRLTRSVPTLSSKDETDAEISTDAKPITTPIEDRQRAGEKVRQG